jgi:hypothetical protein
VTAILRDLLEERAAIIEEGEKCSRADAERKAARMYGFADWQAAMTATEKEGT